MTNQFQSTLLLNFNKIGDTLMQTQLLAGLKIANPQGQIVVLSSLPAAEVLKNNPRIHHLEISSLLPERSVREFVAYRKLCQELIRRFGVDTLICDPVNSTPVSAILLQTLFVKNKIYSASFRTPLHQVLGLGLVRLAGQIEEPMSARFLNLAKYFGCEQEQRLPTEIFPSEKERHRAAEFIHSLSSANDKRPLISLVPLSTVEANQWPAAYFQKLQELTESRYRWVVFDPALTKQFNFRESAEIIRQTQLLVSLNTGPSHLFRWLKIPVLRIDSGREPAEQWGYVGEPGYHYLQSKTDCSWCHLRTCSVPDHPCLTRIKPERVAEKIIEIMKVYLRE